MAAFNSSHEKILEFAKKSRYTFRLGYRKLNEEDVFVRDLNTGSDEERPWLTADEFLSREALLVIAERIKDDNVFKNKRGPKQMNPTHQLMVLLRAESCEGFSFSKNQRGWLEHYSDRILYVLF
jgi:hypothetical protein